MSGKESMSMERKLKGLLSMIPRSEYWSKSLRNKGGAGSCVLTTLGVL